MDSTTQPALSWSRSLVEQPGGMWGRKQTFRRFMRYPPRSSFRGDTPISFRARSFGMRLRESRITSPTSWSRISSEPAENYKIVGAPRLCDIYVFAPLTIVAAMLLLQQHRSGAG